MPVRSITEAMHDILAFAEASKGRSSASRNHKSSRASHPNDDAKPTSSHHRSSRENDKPANSTRYNGPTRNEKHSGGNPSLAADDRSLFLYLEAEREADSRATKKFASDYDRLLNWDSDHRLKSLREAKPSKRRLEELDYQAEEEFQRIKSRMSEYGLVFQRNMARDHFKRHTGDTTDLPPIKDMDWKTVLRCSAAYCLFGRKQECSDYAEILWNACCLIVDSKYGMIKMERLERGSHYH